MFANTNIDSAARKNRSDWLWGFTPQAEIWNGRLAMIGFLSAALTEVFSDQGLLHFWNLL